MEITDVISCGKGWGKLYTPIIKEIVTLDAYEDEVDKKIGISEIREKHGCLDFQVINRDNLTPHLVRLIHNAHLKSECVCEYCGSEDNVGHTTNGWRKTVCNTCWREHILPYLSLSQWADDGDMIRASFNEEEE